MDAKIERIASRNLWTHTYPNGAQFLRSYAAIVAARLPGGWFITDCKYSRTTAIHVNYWRRLEGYPTCEQVSEDWLRDAITKCDREEWV